ncbi:reverse transcriptase domain-containing protein [Tanacetum coccineum]
MASLKYCNKHNQVGFLNKNLKNLESAGVCRDSRLLQKAWHIRYTITEASVRSQADQAGTQSQPSSSTLGDGFKRLSTIWGNAIVKLVKKVKKMEKILKSRRVVLTDPEEEDAVWNLTHQQKLAIGLQKANQIQDFGPTVFMDDFSVFGDSFDSCLSNLEKMLKQCEDTNLVLNWEKCHFMCREGIVLGHKISKSRIEVDRAKVNVIAKLPHPTTVKGVRSFLGHAGFYRRFIQDFSKIARPMTHLLEKETPFVFSKDCIDAFQTLKKKLTEAPILVVSDWNLPFELMCDASDFAIVIGGWSRLPPFQYQLTRSEEVDRNACNLREK